MEPSTAAPVILLTLADPPRATELSVALNAAGELSDGAAPLIVFPALSVPSSGGLSSTARQALCFLALHDVCGSSGAAEVFVALEPPAYTEHELEGLLLKHRPRAVLASLADLEWAASTSPSRRAAVCDLISALVDRGAPIVDVSPPVDSTKPPVYDIWPPSAPPPVTLHGLLDSLHEGRAESRSVMRVFASDTAESCAERIVAAASGLGQSDAGLPLLLGRTALQCLERNGMYGLGRAEAAVPGIAAALRARFSWWRDPPDDSPGLARLPHAPVETELTAEGAAAAGARKGVETAAATSEPLTTPAYRIAVLGGSFNPVTLAHTQV